MIRRAKIQFSRLISAKLLFIILSKLRIKLCINYCYFNYGYRAVVACCTYSVTSLKYLARRRDRKRIDSVSDTTILVDEEYVLIH